MPVKVKLNSSLSKKLDNVRIISAADKAVTDTCRELRDRLAMSPTPKITGNLRRSNSYEIRRGSNMIEGLVKNSANYWVFVNFGTSKRDAVNFVESAMTKVQPAKKIQENFKKYYKGG